MTAQELDSYTKEQLADLDVEAVRKFEVLMSKKQVCIQSTRQTSKLVASALEQMKLSSLLHALTFTSSQLCQLCAYSICVNSVLPSTVCGNHDGLQAVSQDSNHSNVYCP